MLFNSIEFIFFFLPISLFIYFLLNKFKLTTLSKAFLGIASLFFYAWWNIKYLFLIIFSILVNFSLGYILGQIHNNKIKEFISRKIILIIGLIFNVGLLAYFKYTDFLISTTNVLFKTNINLLHIILPLGISFFTFQKIAYLVDSSKGEVKEYNFLNYLLFVGFFPQLIAGPIVHHKEIMPQFNKLRSKVLNYKNLASGIVLFIIGLSKKVLIADTLSVIVGAGFDKAQSLTLIEGWLITFAYTFQLYFDFSGYSDMAIGIAKMFNIDLPLNFNSPYKAKNIQDFWRRWHMTLSKFLRDYIYIPLGGNRGSEFLIYKNVIITFFIGGLWHGAAWTFVVWGLLHGIALAFFRFWQKTNIILNQYLAQFITFLFVCFTWIIFRAKDWTAVKKIFVSLFNFTNIEFPKIKDFNFIFNHSESQIKWLISDVLLIIICFYLCFCSINSIELVKKFKPNIVWLLGIAVLFCSFILNMNKISEFIYFQF